MRHNHITETLHCTACNSEVKAHQKFCYNCGSPLIKAQTSIYNNANLRSVFIFFCLYLFVCLIVRFTNLFNAYSKEFWVEIFIAVLTLLFVQKNISSIKPLLRFHNFNFLRLMGCIALAVTAAIAINIIVSRLNVSFFGTDSGYYSRYDVYSIPAMLMIYSIAVNPALFEELAFRGVMYNYLAVVLDKQSVIIVTAFMFAILHLNLISLFWLIPFGIFAGELRKRYNTIWYGVSFHFTFNLIAVLFDLYKNGYFK